ncbi:MAG: 50S ribosomal protein L9 [Candidatus Pacebacteria bacterium]|nr:50S ribosomal protein L9 [Candidatus Paceibacterota bacterium]MBP9842800.1 50S ribosomal protein L9 [Candidatus Paceibacterota bacterium]
MKVILLRDVSKIGRRNDIVEVPDGYALNQLIPKKWAEAAIPANIKKITAQKAANTAHDEADKSRFEDVLAQLQKETLLVEAGPDDNGHLFKAVHEEDIASSAIAKGVSLDKSWIVLAKPIKALGTQEITLKRGTKSVVCTIEIIKKAK